MKKDKGKQQYSGSRELLDALRKGTCSAEEILTPNTLSLFAPGRLRALREYNPEFWAQRMEELLIATIHPDIYRARDAKRPSFFAEPFEVMAGWDIPYMEREVERNGRGEVESIGYSMNGLRVLTLSRAEEDGRICPRIRPFFLEDDESGYRFCLLRFVEERMHRFLMYFPIFFGYCIARLDGLEREHVKEEKVRTIAKSNIGVMVRGLMAQSGYHYAVEDQAKTSLLRVRMPDQRYLELSLPHRTFLRRTGEVRPTIERVEQLLREVKIPLLLGNKPAHVAWGKTYKEGMTYGKERDVENLFWGEYIEEYVMSCLYADPKEKETDDDAPRFEALDLDTIAQWDIEGMQKKLSYDEGEIEQITYSIGGKRMLSLSRHGVQSHLSYFFIGVIYRFELPPLELWRQLLEGFPELWHKHRKDFDRSMMLVRREAREQRAGRKTIEADVHSQMATLGIETYALDLLNSRTSSFRFPEGARLHIPLKSPRVLTLPLAYEDYRSRLGEIEKAMLRTQETMVACKIPIKVFSEHDWYDYPIQWIDSMKEQ